MSSHAHAEVGVRDAAAAAAMSDPEQNRWFKRRWAEHGPVQSPSEPASPPATQDFELIGRELLAAWRRERADREAAR